MGIKLKCCCGAEAVFEKSKSFILNETILISEWLERHQDCKAKGSDVEHEFKYGEIYPSSPDFSGGTTLFDCETEPEIASE